MFRCQQCDSVVEAGTRSQRLIVKARRKVYDPRGSQPMYGRQQSGGRRGRPKRSQVAYDKGGVGTEIAVELMVCPACAERISHLEKGVASEGV